MKKLLLFSLALCLLAPLGMAQQTERAPTVNPGASLSRGPLQSPGQCCWSMDVETPTGDIRCLGVEYTENLNQHYYVTGAYDFSIAYLHELDRYGNLVASYPQPTGNWGFWGWRDLAWDMKYLYAGDDSNMPGYITQIDHTNGKATGTFYGPYPVVPCRAMAYQTNLDCFWTGSWSSLVYQCFRDGSYTSYPNPSLAGIYGAAMDESNLKVPMLWIWSQDGNGCLASEFDPAAGKFTGRTFDGCLEINNLAGGACAYPTCNGEWEFVGLHQASPDSIVAYCLHDPCPLMADTCAVYVNNGSSVTFLLTAPNFPGVQYLLLGSLSGVYPGIPIPWTSCNMRINFDFFTLVNIMLLNTTTFYQFMGNLDSNGQAKAQFVLPPNSGMPPDITIHFAYILGPKNDFVSNPVEIWTRP